jgi:hypothetical protein
MQLTGEPGDRRKQGVFALVLTAALLVVGVVTVFGPRGSFLAATDVEEPVDRIGNVELGTLANAALSLNLVEAVKAQGAAITAAANAYTALQAQTNSQRDEIASLRDEIAALKERGQKPRARRRVPDTPAASDFKLQ